MERALAAIGSPAAVGALAAALAWAPATGFPTWPALARGRFASTALITAAVATFAYGLIACLLAAAGE